MHLFKLHLTKGWFLFLTATVALGLAGAGYAAWTASLHVEGTVTTGNVGVVWDQQEEVESVGVLNSSGVVVDQPIPPEKDIADCQSDLQPGQTAELVRFKVTGAWPSYTCTIILGGIVTGSVPVHISDIQRMATDGQTGEAVPSSVLEVDVAFTRKVPVEPSGFRCDRLQPLGISSQLHRGDRFCALIRIHPQQPAKMSHTYTGGVWINFIQWNMAGEQVTPKLPVLNVTGVGLSQGQVSSLGLSLGIPASQLHLVNGVATFMDGANFQKVPMTPATADLPSEDSSFFDIFTEAFDFQAIGQMQAMSGDMAMQKVREAATKANAEPMGALAYARHSMFETAMKDPNRLLLPGMSKAIDTQVNHGFNARGFPMVGPGAQFNVAFSPAGQVTQLYHAAHQFSQGADMPVIPMGMAKEKCNALFPGAPTVFTPTLAYFAPDLALGANLLLPHYDCMGTTQLGGRLGNQSANVLQNLIPAVDDPALVPMVSLSGAFDGEEVSATATVVGGRPPYSYHWTSMNADLSGQSGPAVSYFPDPRNAGGDQQVVLNTDLLRVTVVDANGIQVFDTEMISLSLSGLLMLSDDGTLVQAGSGQKFYEGSRSPAGSGLKFSASPLNVGGVTDFGIERAVSDMCSGNVNGYSNRMDDEAFKRFHWTGQSAWERDFKDSSDHNQMVDNVDETFYCGHGWGGGFTFESNVNDGSIVYTDPRVSPNGDWGDNDLEWLALLSCQVLRQTQDGLSWAQRWGPDFDGLHLLLGFQTNAYDWSGFGNRFADWQMGRKIIPGLIELPPIPVRAAWHQAALEQQPSGVQSVVMGTIGPGGLNNFNDFFWGQGPTGPDVREPDITGFWRLVITTP